MQKAQLTTFAEMIRLAIDARQTDLNRRSPHPIGPVLPSLPSHRDLANALGSAQAEATHRAAITS
jgi:hypothetical protein